MTDITNPKKPTSDAIPFAFKLEPAPAVRGPLNNPELDISSEAQFKKVDVLQVRFTETPTASDPATDGSSPTVEDVLRRYPLREQAPDKG